MKITELDLKTEGKRYKCGNSMFVIKNGDLFDVEMYTYLKDSCIPIAELVEMEFKEVKETKNPYFRVRSSKKYYFVGSCGCSETTTDYNHGIDNKLFINANYFNNRNYARYIAFKETLMRRMDRFAWEHNAKVIDWDCNQPKHYIVFNNSSDNKLEVSRCFALQSNCVYFTSKEIAEKAIEEFKEDLMKLYTWEFDF